MTEPTIFKGTEDAVVVLRGNVKHKIIVRHVDRHVPEREANGTALSLEQALHPVKPIRPFLGFGKRHEQLAEDIWR